jgi:hypothetical protein
VDPDVKFCPECGTRLAPTAKFCVSCGATQKIAAQEPEPAPPEPEPAAPEPEPTPPAPDPPSTGPEAAPPTTPHSPPPVGPESLSPPPSGPQSPPAGPQPPPTAGSAQQGAARTPLRERVAAFDPDAGELVGRGAAMLSIPAVVAAGLTALIAALVTLAAGFVLALLFGDDTLIGTVGEDVGIVTEAFRQVPQLLSAGVLSSGAFGAGPTRIAPIVLVVIPFGASLLAARAQAGRIADLSPQWRVAWALGAGVAFALLALVLTLLGGDGGNIEPALGDSFGLALLWGSAGAMAGASGAASDSGVAQLGGRGREALAVAGACLRPLAAVLLLSALLGLWGWVVQTARDVDNTQGGRSEAVALVENGLYVVEHGVHLTALGTFARFESPGLGALGLAFPVEDTEAVASPGASYGVFDLREGLPAYVFVPGLILLVALPAIGALLGGFRVARVRAATGPGPAALWGAIVGPVWAIAVALLSALASKELFGDPSADSIFVSFLLGGAALGALGGFLGVQGGQAQSPPASP